VDVPGVALRRVMPLSVLAALKDSTSGRRSRPGTESDLCGMGRGLSLWSRRLAAVVLPREPL